MWGGIFAVAAGLFLMNCRAGEVLYFAFMM